MSASHDWLLRAALGDLTVAEMASHRERLAVDDAYRAEFSRLTALRGELRDLPVTPLQPGLDVRVMAALRGQSRPNATTETMSRQFWRLAIPTLGFAVLLLGFATRSGTGAATPQSESLASWYPISSDPTARQ